VTAAAHRQKEVAVAGKIDANRDVLDAGATSDQSRPPVDHAIPDLASAVVGVIARTQQLPPQLLLEGSDDWCLEHRAGAGSGRDSDFGHRSSPVHLLSVPMFGATCHATPLPQSDQTRRTHR
jgi:hypothetical protein